MVSMFVKICGLSTAESVDRAVESGADAVGFIFAESPRRVSAAQAKELARRVPDGVETVAVFRGQTVDDAIEVSRAAGTTTIQFHGYASLADLQRAREAGFRTLRAFGVDEYAELTPEERDLWSSERLLIDAIEPGSGVTFDAKQLEHHPTGWWLLAGGLNPENVAALITNLQPVGVDVSSGVESSRGVKSLELISDFVAAAKQQPSKEA